MDIDNLVLSYYVKVEELKQKSSADKSSKKQNDNTSTKDEVLRWVIFFGIILAAVVLLLAAPLKNLVMFIASLFAFVGFVIIDMRVSTSAPEIKKSIKSDLPRNRKRLKALKQLLIENRLEINDETIKVLTKAIKQNKNKYDSYKKPKKLAGITITIISSLGAAITFITGIIKEDFVADIVKNAESSENITISSNDLLTIQIFCIALIVVLAVAVGFLFVELDPKIRKLYYFHDSFIYDLEQLRIFKITYGINAASIKTISSQTVPQANQSKKP